jgi:putative ABC transport system permease protein
MSAAAVEGDTTPGRPSPIARPRLPVRGLLGTALQGLRTRRLRAALSALGIAIGGRSDGRRCRRLGLQRGQPAGGDRVIGDISNVPDDAAVYQVPKNVYRTPLVPTLQTGGIGVDAAGENLPQVMGTRMLSGHFLGAVANRFPEAVLGYQAAQVLQITRAEGNVMVYLGSTWFSVIGIMSSATLDTSLDPEVFISLPVAEHLFRAAPNPSGIYVRTNQNDVIGVSDLLAATADPQDPSGVAVSRPSDALKARAAAKGQFTTLLVGLGAVALLVGAIGIANIMVISVLERRGEIGLRRALGATRRHITLQFLTESALLAVLGGIAGLIIGTGATLIYAHAKTEPFLVPLYALIAAPAAGLVIGAIAGPYPATKAARLSPPEALRAT